MSEELYTPEEHRWTQDGIEYQTIVDHKGFIYARLGKPDKAWQLNCVFTHVHSAKSLRLIADILDEMNKPL